MSGAWLLDSLDLLPTPVAVAVAAAAAGPVVWWTALRARSARQAVEHVSRDLAERDRAFATLDRLAEAVETGRKHVDWAVSEVERGKVYPGQDAPSVPERTGDVCVDVVAALEVAQTEAWQAVLHGVAHQHGLLDSEAELADIFRSIAPRLQTLINRTMTVIGEVERNVEDPDLLRDWFRVDHLVTQIRRAVESLAVLGGSTPARDAEPVLVYKALRRAVAEIPDFPRVRLAPQTKVVALPGYVTPNVVHLLAELMENATRFSSTKVEVHTHHVPGGMAIELLDRGTGMSEPKRTALNQLLADPESADPRGRLKEGHLGLLVAAKLAKRHKIGIQLRPNVLGGTQAIVYLPDDLLVTPSEPPAIRINVPPPTRRDAISPHLSGPSPAEAGPVPVASELPRRIPPAEPTAHSQPATHHEADPAAPAGGRPPLPRRSDTQPGSQPSPNLPAQQGPSGHPTSTFFAQFNAGTKSAPPAD
ncbi:ATP-binding protein [Streptomyces sp. NPDC020681]|uniref:ATP-binding protein n=1 Tax=Streptomyces sp. NPDC020681 TaxID=3365083 RepID=UPI0037AD459A